MPEIDLAEAAKAVANLNRGFEEYKSAADARLAELEAKGSADALFTDKLKRIEADLHEAKAVADEAMLALKRRERLAETAGPGNEREAKAAKWADHIALASRRPAAKISADDMDAYGKAFASLVRKNFHDNALTEAERKALSIGVAPDGGYFVPDDLSGRIVAKEFETSPMRAFASIQTISTDRLTGTYDNNEVGAGWVAETASRPTTSTPQVGRWEIPVEEMYAFPEATQSLLEDSAVAIEPWLANKIGTRFARLENTAFVTGTGVGQPRGFLTYADGTDLTNSIEQVGTGASGAFAGSGAGMDVFQSALYKLKGVYRRNAVFFMNRTTLGEVMKQKDSDGRYIWQPNAQAGAPSTLAGFPVAPDFEDMPIIAAASLSIAVGDMRAAYQIVDRIGVSILRDPFTNKPYVGFYARKRVGGDMVNGEALKIIRFS
jgi:HK97 family phage major capsid protein